MARKPGDDSRAIIDECNRDAFDWARNMTTEDQADYEEWAQRIVDEWRHDAEAQSAYERWLEADHAERCGSCFEDDYGTDEVPF